MSHKIARSIFICLTLFLAGCIQGEKTGTEQAVISGTISYRERIALLPGFKARVLLEDVSRADAPATIIAEKIFEITGQVPVRFDLVYDPDKIVDRHRYGIRAQFLDPEGRLRWTTNDFYSFDASNNTGDIQLLVHPAGSDAGTVMQPVETGKTHVFECDEFAFSIRTGPGELALYLPDRYVVLSQVRAASGAKYVEGDIVFWNKGSEALLEIGNKVYDQCRANAVRVPRVKAGRYPVDLRATGNEPGWIIEVVEGRSIRLVMNYGQTELVFSAPAFLKTKTGRVLDLTTEAHHLTVHIENIECQDTMSGALFNAAARVELDEKLYSGCAQSF